MNNQDLTQMPPTGEDQDDAGPEIGGWSVFWAVLLGVGFVGYVTFAGIGDEPGLYRRLHIVFVVLGGVGITGVALAALTRRRKPKPKPPASQDLA